MLLPPAVTAVSFATVLLRSWVQASTEGRVTREGPGITHSSNEQRQLDAPQPRVVGGDDADVGEYPFFVHGIDGELCGGTLIHPDIVLTAAHCEGAFSGDVIIGSTDLYAQDSPERIDIDFLLPHPDYTP